MDRGTRKANFKKLQLPAPIKSRTTRASKQETATATISKYFDTPQKAGPQQTDENLRSSQELPADPGRKASGRGRPTKLNTFLFKSEDSVVEETEVPKKKPRESDFFEPTQRKVKKAPKLKNETARSTRKTRAKGQPNIKSAFLRNEQMFAEITAQHCLADDFSPDDIRLALAISQSEVDSESGQARTEEIADINQRDSVRAKLQKYGFRTASKEDYSVQAFNRLPGITGGRRAKWANKFTALTLRQPERQAKKLQANVEALMAQQCKVKPQNDNGNVPLSYTILTATLASLAAAKDCKIVAKTMERCPNDLSDFYVNELFETSTLPASHLLKNWKAIQGRDLSPEPPNVKSRARAQKLRAIYAELESHFGKKQLVANDEKNMACEAKQTGKLSTEAVTCDDELSKLVQLIKADTIHAQKTERPNSQSSINSTPAEEPPDKRARMNTATGEEDSTTYTTLSIAFESQTTRATSPDIFADSEEDDEKPYASTDTTAMLNFSTQECEHITMQVDDKNITSYEVFSSDEVKTSCADNVNRSTTTALSISLNNSIDLTQELVDESEKGYTLSCTPFVTESTATETMKTDCVFELSSETESDDEGMVIKFPDDSHITSQLSANAALQDTTGETGPLSLEQEKSNASLDLIRLLNVDDDNGLPQSADYSSSVKSRKSHSFSLDVGHECSQTSLHSFKLPRDTSGNSSVFSGMVRNESTHSIDLTGDDSDDENFIILSDDEINYSIRKADKTLNTKESVWQFEKSGSSSSTHNDALNMEFAAERSTNLLQLTPPNIELDNLPANFDHDDAMEAFLVSTQTGLNSSGSSHSPNKSALSRERAEFGIMDAALSEPLTESQLVSQPLAEQTAINWTEDTSFLDASSEFATVSVKRFSRNRRSSKFVEFLADEPPEQPLEVARDEIDDEFDRLVCCAMESVYKLKAQATDMPSGLDQLLTGELSFQEPEDTAKAKKLTPTETQQEFEVPEQLEVNGNVYTVRVCTSPKPDYMKMSDEERLKQLYNFGIKPLNRRQATKMLEFIYNQTHPIMLDTDDALTATNQQKPSSWSKSKSTPVLPSNSAREQAAGDKHLPLTQIKSTIFPKTAASPQVMDVNATSKLKLQDAFGDTLLRYSQQLQPALTSDDEWFVLQTNISKKTPQPLLPLHIAWHNLLCANPTLHESVLMYEPIDLQEIYLYLKSLGYRYDPKDLKSFLDRRCIIFRYDLSAAVGKPATNRHVRKASRQKQASKGAKMII